ELPGRKAIMLFSDGFKLKSDNQPNRIMERMRVLADMANRSSVVIYTLDPRGLDAPGMANANDDIRQVIGSGFNPANLESQRTRRAADYLDQQQSLRYLAYETGGIPFINRNNLNNGLQQAVSEYASYYLLGYQPDEDTFDPKKNKFNNLEVKVTRPELKVRYRSGFFSVTDKKILNGAQTPQQKLLTALTSPFSATGINLNLYPVYQNVEKTGNIIQALIYINAKDLKFTEAADGKRKANFDLIAMTFGDNGVPIDRYSKNYTLEAAEDVYRNIMENGFVYTLPVPIKKSGAYQFRIALLDTNSNKVGSASQFIEVPDIKKRMALSNIVLDNFTAKEWQEVKLDGNGGNSEKTVLFDTVLRRFKVGTIVLYDYFVYNPKNSRQIETQLRLIKDGKIVYEKNPTPLKIKEHSDLLRLPVAGTLTLGKNLEVGNYVLQVIAIDGRSGKEFATQFVEFEVIN
ncbi:MAG TPA: VWA domain-containing protein, partial [Pyrinomonadaceae bacterium]|nr:VWA domain-containing protein [Pyrinomonadaceae bacterium]